MTRNPHYDILFEPVTLGPVTAKNRFYQVPHCNGMGSWAYPSSWAEMRGIKAEGGWAVVCTEEVEIHHSSELSPIIEGRLWDDRDIPAFARMCDKVHEHGGLAGIEPAHLGAGASNRYSRDVPMAPSPRPVDLIDPIQARAMDKSDIRAFRRWYVDAAKRGKAAGFDVVYVYAGHDMTTLMHFLSRDRNHRTDEYGGSLENRVRLLREVLYETKEAVGDTCAIAIRLAVDEMRGTGGITSDGEGRDIVEMLADLPDLWDVNVSDWANDSATSRFSDEGFQDSYVSFVKQVTQKPVVGVGRYTSPDTMVRLVKSGHIDMIGAARPSIADPFLPKKIEEGRIEDIRECIGCNICVTGDFQSVPMRCTQNPTMGEEWRRGWHPEKIASKASDSSVLIVGAGPAGLEAARALGQRGYDVTLADAGDTLGGRVALERRLPGLSEWGRVADYRAYQISQMANVGTYLESRLSAANVLEFAADHVVIATGSRWRVDGMGRTHPNGFDIEEGSCLVSPRELLEGAAVEGPVVIFDDDHYYMGGVLAEKLRADGHEVTLVTPQADVSHFTHFTLEQARIQKRLIELDVQIVPLHRIARIAPGLLSAACVYTDREQVIAAQTVVPVTMRDPQDALYHAVRKVADEAGTPPRTVTRIGDCLAPGTIAAAVYAGHRYARELEAPSADGVPFRREMIHLAGCP